MEPRRPPWQRSVATFSVVLVLTQTGAWSSPKLHPLHVAAFAPVATLTIRATPRPIGMPVTTTGGDFSFAGETRPLSAKPHVVLLPTPRHLEPHAPQVFGPSRGPTLTLRATAYNSLADQTDDTPFITATGARTRWGIVAVSRDLLGGTLPYGSLVRLRDQGTFFGGRGEGTYDALLADTTFVVEDTMHPRKTQQVDVWFAEKRQALAWGVRRVEVELIRYGRNGPMLIDSHAFDAPAHALAFR